MMQVKFTISQEQMKLLELYCVEHGMSLNKFLEDVIDVTCGDNTSQEETQKRKRGRPRNDEGIHSQDT